MHEFWDQLTTYKLALQPTSYAFLLVFLPIAALGFHVLLKQERFRAAKAWLLLASIVYYCSFGPQFLPVILGSGLVNALIGIHMLRTPRREPRDRQRYWLLVGGITFNLVVLVYFKYLDFIIDNVNALAHSHIPLPHIRLAPGISFFTFTQISYIVDAYRSHARKTDWLSYYLFVSWFPHIVVGPILHHKEIFPQFETLEKRRLSYRNLCVGIFLIIVGLFKKVVFANYFQDFADNGFDRVPVLHFIDAWSTSLAYTLYVYWDFSGATDVALGTSLLFNIELPLNFNSPYKALNMQNYWRQWHMSLGRFLREYVYIPLGGSRFGELMTFRNLVITFTLCGLWHGAGWGYILWGLSQGIIIIGVRLWHRTKIQLPRLIAVFIAFNFFNFSHIPFRSGQSPQGLSACFKVLRGMAGMTGFTLPEIYEPRLAASVPAWVSFGEVFATRYLLVALALGIAAVLTLPNSIQMAERFKPTWKSWLFLAGAAILALAGVGRVHEFLYFTF